MLVLALMMIVAMMCVECVILHSYPRIAHFLEVHPGRALIFSLALSFVLGIIFPAAGLVVMLGGIFSTIAMQPIYMFRRKRAEYVVHRDERREKRRERFRFVFERIHQWTR